MNDKVAERLSMQKIKTFFRSFWLSCTSPTYYAEILRTKFSFSLKYLLVFQFAITLVVGLFVLIPVSQFNLTGFLNNVKTIYPNDLEVSVNDGKLAINQPLPYRVPLPAMMDDQMGPTRWSRSDGDIKYLLVFESDENIKGAADVYAQDALAVVTESTIYTRESEREGMRVNPIPNEESFTVNRGMVDQAFNAITSSPFVQNKLYVPLLALFIMLIVLPVMIVASLIMVAVYGFFVWLMARFLKNWMMAGDLLSYTKAVQVSIHSLTLVNVVHFLLRWIGEGRLLDGGKFLLAFLAWTGFVLYQSMHQKGQPVKRVKTTVPARTRVAAKAPAKKSKK
jgi:hypothetical protein